MPYDMMPFVEILTMLLTAFMGGIVLCRIIMLPGQRPPSDSD